MVTVCSLDGCLFVSEARVAATIISFPQYEQKRYYVHLLQEMLITRQVGKLRLRGSREKGEEGGEGRGREEEWGEVKEEVREGRSWGEGGGGGGEKSKRKGEGRSH